jgi:alpha-beta hydrolase superfamily lysophospholipase
VLLLHGLGASSHYWDEVTARVEGQRMVAPDLLGFGRSPAPPEVADDVACHLEALEPFIDDVCPDGRTAEQRCLQRLERSWMSGALASITR